MLAWCQKTPCVGCPETFEGRRNRSLIALLADAALRVGEALRLRIEDVNFAARTLSVRWGKARRILSASSGQKQPSISGRGCLSVGTLSPRTISSATSRSARSRAMQRQRFCTGFLSGLASPQDWPARTPTLRCDVHSQADRRPGAGSAGAPPRKLGDGAAVCTPHEAGRERQVQEGEPAR